MTFGEQLRVARQRQNLTLRQVSERTGHAVSYLSDLERGRSNPAATTLAGIADALGMDLEFVCREAYGIPVRPHINAALIAFSRREGLSDEETLMLATVAHRGKRPETSAGYRFLWDAIRLVCEGELI